MESVFLTGGHEELIERKVHSVAQIEDLLTDPAGVLGDIWTSIPRTSSAAGSRVPTNHAVVNFYYDTPVNNVQPGIKIVGTKGVPVINVFVPILNPRGSIAGGMFHRKFDTLANVFDLTQDNAIGLGNTPVVATGANTTNITFTPFDIGIDKLNFAFYDSGQTTGNCAMHLDMSGADKSTESWTNNVARMLHNPNELMTHLNGMKQFDFVPGTGNVQRVAGSLVKMKSDVERRNFKASLLVPLENALACGVGWEETTCIKAAGEFKELQIADPNFVREVMVSGVVVYKWCTPKPA
jgi:hypothetical protein